jgi:hypothetical protein
MPTLCKYENCRTRPKIGGLYCSIHNDISVLDDYETIKCRGVNCTSKPGSKNFKGYCSDCYIRIFEDDPLTFQTRCKTKEIAINEFIHCYFDGFAHTTPLWFGTTRIDNRIRIGNTTLCIEVVKQHVKSQQITVSDGQKYIFIRFNPDKYTIGTKSYNPMLYTRLPFLEKEINHQINRVLQNENVEAIEIINLFYNLP